MLGDDCCGPRWSMDSSAAGPAGPAVAGSSAVNSEMCHRPSGTHCAAAHSCGWRFGVARRRNATRISALSAERCAPPVGKLARDRGVARAAAEAGEANSTGRVRNQSGQALHPEHNLTGRSARAPRDGQGPGIRFRTTANLQLAAGPSWRSRLRVQRGRAFHRPGVPRTSSFQGSKELQETPGTQNKQKP